MYNIIMSGLHGDLTNVSFKYNCIILPFYNCFLYFLTIVNTVLIDLMFNLMFLVQIFDSDASFSEDVIDEIRDKLAS